MGCRFCVTGSYGFHGNLTVQEIISQVIGIPEAALITHVVFMGMGEPLDNLASTLQSVEILTSPWGLSLSHGHVTVSTVGVPGAVKEFLDSAKCNLTLSLFSPFSDERRMMIPAENADRAIDIIKLMQKTRVTGRRRFTIAYMMVNGVNDSQRHLDELKVLLTGTGIRVNIIPYHGFKGAGMAPSPPDLMAKFRHELTISGVSASIRRSRGEDISAACGLLASELKKPSDL
jgi:23S rRNA (adenine2503-C2)-methyltransferase